MKTVELILPGETADRILNHPWASTVLPNFTGRWFRNTATGECEFRATLSESKLQDFLAGIQLLEPELRVDRKQLPEDVHPGKDVPAVGGARRVESRMGDQSSGA